MMSIQLKDRGLIRTGRFRSAEHPGHKGSREIRAVRGRKERRAHKEIRAVRDRKATRGLKVRKVVVVHKAIRDQLTREALHLRLKLDTDQEHSRLIPTWLGLPARE